jgi:hypothetical protein
MRRKDGQKFGRRKGSILTEGKETNKGEAEDHR